MMRDSPIDQYEMEDARVEERFLPRHPSPRMDSPSSSTHSGIAKIYISCKNNEKLRLVIDLFLCNFIRLCFIIESAFCIFYLINLTTSLVYLVTLVPVLVIIADDIFVSLRRRGKEYSWFSITNFSYTCIKLITIWGIVTFRHFYMNDKCEISKENETTHDPFWRANLTNVCPFLELFVSIFIIFCIIGRWLYPTKKEIAKEDISELLLMFLNHGADMVDFFSYIDEEEIVKDFTVVCVILVIFTISVTQFSFALVARRSIDIQNNGMERVLDIIFGTPIWTLILMLCVQDIPFFITRIVILTTIEKTSKNYTLYLFAVKNITKIFVMLVRIGLAAKAQIKLKKDFNDSQPKNNKRLQSR